MTKKTEYKVKFHRKDRQWQVIHMHSYPNFNTAHIVYAGDDWFLCMWIATGDLFYFPGRPYITLCQKFCGSRNAKYLQHGIDMKMKWNH